jgi:hypothetical protein
MRVRTMSVMLVAAGLLAGCASIGGPQHEVVEDVSLDASAIAESWTAYRVPANDYDASVTSAPVGIPAHIQVLFDGQEPDEVGLGDAVLYIIPRRAYREQWAAAGNDILGMSLDLLQQILERRPTLQEQPLPTFPYEAIGIAGLGGNVVGAHRAYFDLPWGQVVRNVAEYKQSSEYITGDSLYYVAQGLSADGRFLVSFFHPLSTDAVPAALDDVPEDAQQLARDEFPEHRAQTVATLEAVAPEVWAPGLDDLDAVLASLTLPPE